MKKILHVLLVVVYACSLVAAGTGSGYAADGKPSKPEFAKQQLHAAVQPLHAVSVKYSMLPVLGAAGGCNTWLYSSHFLLSSNALAIFQQPVALYILHAVYRI
jgi:hypothetical protein